MPTRTVQSAPAVYIARTCLLALALMFFMTPDASSQDDPSSVDPWEDQSTRIGLAYSLGFASGDLHSFTDEMSPVGFDYIIEMQTYRGLHLGGSVGYNRFHQVDPRQTYHFENGDVNAKLYRSFSNLSLAVSSRYYLLDPKSRFNAFGGLRLGVAFATASLIIADFSWLESPVGFLLTPEAGVTLKLFDPIWLAASYQYVYTTESFKSVDSASYHALQLGFQIAY